MLNIKTTDETRINGVSTADAVKTLGELVMAASPLHVANIATTVRAIETLAKKIGAEAISEGSKIYLEKTIDGRKWRILTVDTKKKTIDVVVDVKRFRRQSIAIGITAKDISVSGYEVRQLHEVRAQFAWLLNGQGIEIVRKNGERVIVKQILMEEKLSNGDVVRYNTWDFRPFAIFEADLTDATILCNSPEHKKEFILKLADEFCNGNPKLQGIFSPEVEALLRKYHETRKVSAAYLPGYEIHHHGYGKMLLLPNDIHCRKLAHTGGSLLMNTRYYAVYIDNPSGLAPVENILRTELSLENLEKYMQMSIEEREKFLLDLGGKMLVNLDLSDVEITIGDLEPDSYGFYCDKTRTIYINPKLLAQSPSEALLTELHEIRHAIQHDAIRNPGKYGFDNATIQSWKNNFCCYIDPRLDLMGYKLQPVEKDAEEWALAMLNINNSDYYV